jgi:very-short-patch-repair endonuclease
MRVPRQHVSDNIQPAMSTNRHYHHYNRGLKHFGRRLRNNSTKAEIHLWCELLRAKKMMGYSFLRQRPIFRYIADFMCKDLKLIIEVDGGYHQERVAEDEQRDKDLLELGYTTLRFSNEEVLEDLNAVEDRIRAWIEGQR